MRGTDVKELQKILIAKKFLADDGNATGYFGAATRAALVAFQKANGLEAVGYTGPRTRELLNKGI
jgi:peptidoglycan hydrolase-like protein with peptidoglycan-binding domain